jgi:PAS domain S-box-containing protein
MSSENDRFRMMVEHSQDWFWEFDENANFTYVSPRIRDLLGYEPEELIGLNAFELMTEDEAERVHRHFDPIVKKYLPFNNLININRHKDGHEVLIESSGTPIFDKEGQFRGYRGIDRDIRERKVMEENYRLLTGLTSDYVHYCTRSGKSKFQIRWIGGAVNPISGYSIKELLALGCFLPMVHPDDQQRVSDHLLSLVPGDRKTIEFRILTQQQEIRWVSEKSQCNAGPSEGELTLLGAVTDITERKQSEERLRESEERCRNIAEMLPEVVFELDLSGNLIFANRKAFEIFGYTEEAFVRGLNAFDMVVPEERAQAKERIHQRMLGEEVGAKEYTALRKDGSTFPVLLNAIPIVKEREPVGILGIMTDITERKSNEIALLAATQAAESASQTKDLFLAKVSHEIRTPLTTIVGFGELLEDTDLTPEQKKYLAAINSSGSTLASLIDDVLDLSKVEAGKLALNLKDFSLHALISKLVATQAQQIEEKGLQVNISIDPDIPDLLIGDSLRIQQVFLNLLCNAIKFTEKGEINISAAVVEKTGLRVLLEIAVEDTGIGISADLQEHIFEPFAQILNPSRPNCVGSGLGLTISRSLAGLMGGSIRVVSQEGIGSTFHLLVPLQSKIDNLSDKALTEKESSLWSDPVLNILLAEDNPVNADFIKTVLKNMGHGVTVAENGKVALDTLNANTFDVVLMDIQMPVMNGTDALSVIREQEKITGNHLIVIALTAYALVGDKEKYLKMGFDGYLSKPFRTNELIDEMVRVVST